MPNMTETLSPRQRAAATLLALPLEQARKVLNHLDPEEASVLSLEMARMPRMEQQSKADLLLEFRNAVREESGSLEGGARAAEQLFASCGELPSAKAALLSLKTELPGRPFGSIRALPPRILKALLSHEHPQVTAMVLAYLPLESGREILEAFDPEERAEIAMRIVALRDRPPKRPVIESLEERLAAAADEMLSAELPPAGGMPALVDLVKRMGQGSKSGVVQGIEKLSPETAKALSKQLFTFEDILLVDDRGIQALLKGVETRDLAMALKGSSGQTQEKVLKNLSERGGEMLKEEMEVLGSPRRVMIEASQEKILATLMQLEKDGTVTVNRGDE
jgi:flagellar motor switch protein FliG